MNAYHEFRPLTELPGSSMIAAAQQLNPRLDPGRSSSRKMSRSGTIAALYPAYLQLLRNYLDDNSEDTLLEAYNLGQEALRTGMNLVNAGEMHHKAMRQLATENVTVADASCCAITAMSTVFDEFLTPFEMNYRGYRQASAAMRHLNETMEAEIRRIAQSLHDDAGQYLACVHIALYDIARRVSPELKSDIASIQQMLDALENELRLISHELRPRILEESGLSNAIEFIARAFSIRTGLEIHISNELVDRPDAVIETTIYRCVQELLKNACRHADAKKAEVILYRTDDTLVCQVRDDGKGFDAREAMLRSGGEQLGLLGLMERVSALDGSIVIDSAPGKASCIRIEIPQK
jgi:signal transduction histidine kinase